MNYILMLLYKRWGIKVGVKLSCYVLVCDMLFQFVTFTSDQFLRMFFPLFPDLYNLQRSITCAKTIVREQGIHAW